MISIVFFSLPILAVVYGDDNNVGAVGAVVVGAVAGGIAGGIVSATQQEKALDGFNNLKNNVYYYWEFEHLQKLAASKNAVDVAAFDEKVLYYAHAEPGAWGNKILVEAARADVLQQLESGVQVSPHQAVQQAVKNLHLTTPRAIALGAVAMAVPLTVLALATKNNRRLRH